MNKDRYQLVNSTKGKLNQEIILHIEEVLTHYAIQSRNDQIDAFLCNKKVDEIFDFLHQVIEFNE